MKKEDFYDTYIEMKSEEESRKIQDILFRLGYKWGGTGLTNICNTDKKYLHCWSDNIITWSYFTGTEGHSTIQASKILDDLINLLEPYDRVLYAGEECIACIVKDGALLEGTEEKHGHTRETLRSIPKDYIESGNGTYVWPDLHELTFIRKGTKPEAKKEDTVEPDKVDTLEMYDLIKDKEGRLYSVIYPRKTGSTYLEAECLWREECTYSGMTSEALGTGYKVIIHSKSRLFNEKDKYTVVEKRHGVPYTMPKKEDKPTLVEVTSYPDRKFKIGDLVRHILQGFEGKIIQIDRTYVPYKVQYTSKGKTREYWCEEENLEWIAAITEHISHAEMIELVESIPKGKDLGISETPFVFTQDGEPWKPKTDRAMAIDANNYSDILSIMQYEEPLVKIKTGITLLPEPKEEPLIKIKS